MWDYYISRETKFLKRAKTICYGHSSFKRLKSDAQKVPKQAEAKRDGVINPQNYDFDQF